MAAESDIGYDFALAVHQYLLGNDCEDSELSDEHPPEEIEWQWHDTPLADPIYNREHIQYEPGIKIWCETCMKAVNGPAQWKDHCQGSKHMKLTKKFRWGRPNGEKVQKKSDFSNFQGSAEDRRIAMNQLERIIKDLEDSTDPDFIHTGSTLQ